MRVEFDNPSERTQLRETVRRAVQAFASEQQIRAAMESDSGFDADLWKVLSGDLGLTTMLVADSGAASPGRFADLAAALEELGRGPVCAPILGSAVLAPALLTACGGRVAEELSARLSSGQTRATASVDHDAASVAVRAAEQDGRVVLDGTDRFVIDAPGAEFVLVPAVEDGVLGIYAVTSDTEGYRCTPLSTMDQTRRAGRLDLVGAPARRVAAGAPAVAALARTRHVAQAALAAEQVGGAQRCVELTVSYVKSRQQFGVPIGSFQAIKHACADMLVAVEFARSVAEYAAFCVDQRPDDLPTAALTAAALCSENYLAVTERTIQLHGGIGFTWDNYAHLYFKRAKSSALMFGQPTQQRAELAGVLGL